MESSTIHTKGIGETPTARPACVDTNQMFLSMTQGYSAGDFQSTKEVKENSEKTCVSRVPLSSHSPCATAISLPDSLCTSILGTHLCRTDPPSHSRSKELVLTAYQYCCGKDVKDSTAVKELFYQFLS